MNKPAKKIQMDHIVIVRGEGPSELCGKKRFAATWEEASAILADIAVTAPKGGGYDKVDFMVYWADGERYEGRADIEHKHVTGYSLQKHMQDFLTFMAGVRKPAHMAQAQYDRYLATLGKDKAESAAYLAKYDI